MEFTEQELVRYRSVLAPLFKDRTITGFNIYPKIPVVNTPLAVNYLHEDLDEGNPHKKELLSRITENRSVRLVQTAVFKRQAAYVSAQTWLDEERPNIYDFNGRPISVEQMAELGEYVQEDLQYDMAIEVESVKDLADLLNILDGCVNKFKLDRHGNILSKLNPSRLKRNPWDIPVVLVTAQGFAHPRYCGVEKFSIRKGASEISTVVTNTANNLSRKLDGAQVQAMRSSLLANRGFANWITV